LSANIKKTVALITMGCAKNLVDSEVMLGFLRRAGYNFVQRPGQAEVLILNTCGFIGPAKEEAEQAIGKAVRQKKGKPEKRVVVAGCYVQRYGQELAQRYPEVDAWLGVADFDKIVPAVEGRDFRRGSRTFLCSHTTPRVVSTPRSWAYLKISEGCSHRCSFCAIPLIKGPYRSRAVASIVKEAEELAANGVKEINLVSQDSTNFGRDLGGGAGLAGLLLRLVEIPRIRWIRVLYGYPEEITEPLLEVMGEEKICPYIDIPFQHSDSRILRLMKRSMDGKRGLALVDRIRRRLPDIALRTTLIVGFPGEGPREFAALKDFVRAARFDHLGVFTYSPEESTAAFPLGNPVPEPEKQKRRDEIMSLQARISESILRKYLNRRLDVLLDGPGGKDGKTITGRTRFQAPEVDGVVRIGTDTVAGRPLRAIEKVEITGTGVYDLRGKLAR
jgi:ribosomal protein S12 methylthiotransferase